MNLNGNGQITQHVQIQYTSQYVLVYFIILCYYFILIFIHFIFLNVILFYFEMYIN